MRALGMIETMGLIPSIEALDAMLKAANVETLEKTNVRGGIVTVIVIGDVSAVQAAVDAGAAAVERVSQGALLSQHVIPRPDSQTELLFKNNRKMKNNIEIPNGNTEPEEVVVLNANTEPEKVVVLNANTEPEKVEVLNANTEPEEVEVSNGNTEPKEVVVLNANTEPKEVVVLNANTEPEKVEVSNANTEPEKPVVLNAKPEKPVVLNTKVKLELFLEEQGIEKMMQVINNMRYSDLKDLSKKYKTGELQEDKNIKVTKAELVDRIYDFYSKGHKE